MQTLLKWLFWTSINSDIILKNIILAEVFVLISCAFIPMSGPLATLNIYMIFKQNKQLERFIFTQNMLLH